MNRVLYKLRFPYKFAKAFDHREDMVSPEQVANFALLIEDLFDREVPGDFVELGCYTGSTAVVFGSLIKAREPSRKLHVYDRFDLELGSARDIRSIFDEHMRTYKVPDPVVHAGDLFDTVPTELPDTIAFAHVDLGIGGSVDDHAGLIKHGLQGVYPRMARGGLIVLMDYHIPGVTVSGNDTNPGVRKASDAFFADKPEEIRLLAGGACSHAYVRKA
ncbi:MAG: TylF/MycF/NovP-related O-methyltransferase [Flavobacteriales bacterium]